MNREVPVVARLAILCLLALVAFDVFAVHVPYVWPIAAALVGIVIFAIPKPARSRENAIVHFQVAIISPFSTRLLAWYLRGRATVDGRRIDTAAFRSVEEWQKFPKRWDAVIVYEDLYAELPRAGGQSVPIRVAMSRGRLTLPSGIVLGDDVARMASPPDLLTLLPIDRYVAHPGSTRLLIIVLIFTAIVISVAILLVTRG